MTLDMNSNIVCSSHYKDDTTKPGIFLSRDSGTSWVSVSDGLTDLDISSMFTNKDGSLFAGTTNSGIFKSQHLLAVQYDFRNIKIMQGFSCLPNPATDASTIHIIQTENNHLMLFLSDALGHTTTTIIDEQRDIGDYSQLINTSNLPNGVYTLVLNSGGKISTTKLVVSK
jgi:hypothetical protein